MDDDIFDYDFTQGGGDMTYFGGGDTSWIDNFNWDAATDSLNFSDLNLGGSGFGSNFGTDYFNNIVPDISNYIGDYFNAYDLAGIDLDTLRYVDQPALPASIADYYADSVSTPAIDVEGNLNFYNPDGSVVTYSDYTTPGSLIQTQDPSGRTSFYHTTDGTNYFVDYSDLTPGSLVETFSQGVEGGPTRYDAYSGTGADAKHVTYSDVYGPGGGTITTTSDGVQYVYKDGDVFRVNEDGSLTKEKTPPSTVRQQLQNVINSRKTTNIRPPDIPELERFTPGRGTMFSPLAGASEIPLARIDIGSIGNIFPSESVLDRLAGQMPIRVAEGGSIEGHNPEFFSEGGHRYVRGDGDGTSDSVPAMLARGEYVIPADVVSALGNGDNEAGAETMDEFLKVVRSHKRDADPEDLPDDSMGPLSYLAEAEKNLRD